MLTIFNDTVRSMTEGFFYLQETQLLRRIIDLLSRVYKIPMFTWCEEISVLLKFINCPNLITNKELSDI